MCKQTRKKAKKNDVVINLTPKIVIIWQPKLHKLTMIFKDKYVSVRENRTRLVRRQNQQCTWHCWRSETVKKSLTMKNSIKMKRISLLFVNRCNNEFFFCEKKHNGEVLCFNSSPINFTWVSISFWQF